MTEMETFCTSCDETATSTTPHCPECGAEDPWDDRPKYEFDEEDLPHMFRQELFGGDWGVWNAFCESYFGWGDLTGNDIAGLPDDLPSMHGPRIQVFYVLTPGLELEGPFNERVEAVEVMKECDSE